jgi:ornithine decarboxylase
MFGAEEKEAKRCFEYMQRHGMHLPGFHFHLGSGSAMRTRIHDATAMIQKLLPFFYSAGHKLEIVDSGGGFTSEHCDADAPSIQKFWKSLPVGVAKWAEPGRLFADSCYSLGMKVLDKQWRTDSQGNPILIYHVNDSVYNVLNGARNDGWLFENQTPDFYCKDTEKPSVNVQGAKTIPCYFKGQTCDWFDALPLMASPELSVGDHVFIDFVGAYGASASTKFNGMTSADLVL